jgi:hypothetical protein
MRVAFLPLVVRLPMSCRYPCDWTDKLFLNYRYIISSWHGVFWDPAKPLMLLTAVVAAGAASHA